MNLTKNDGTNEEGEFPPILGTHQGKTYRLRRRRNPNGDWSPFYYVDFETGGKRVNQSTGTSTLQQAHIVAKKKLGAAMLGRWDALEGTKVKSEVATLAEVAEVFRAHMPSRAKVSQRTAGGYVNMLKSMLRIVRESDDMGVRCSVLTREFVLEYKAKKFPAKGSMEEQERAVTGINSAMTQARGLFSKRALELYKDKGLKLPDLSGFLAVDKFKDERDVSFRPIPEEMLAKMDAAAFALLEADPGRAVKGTGEKVDLRPARPDVFLAYLMARFLGMRDIEIAAARWEWVEAWPDGKRMAIVRRPYFRPKYTEGRVPMDDQLGKLLDQYGDKESLWIVPARTKTDRSDVVYRAANFFVRQFLPDREKGMHELRKQAGSAVYTQTKSLSMAAEFLRNKEETCRKHYAKLLVPPPALAVVVPKVA